MNLPRADVRPAEILRRSGWVKSSASCSCSACVEVLVADGQVHLRDSKFRGAGQGPWYLEPVLSVMPEEFQRLLDVVVGRPSSPLGDLVIEEQEDGSVVLRSRVSGGALHFHDYEWAAFRLGAEQGEFEHRRLVAAV